MKHLESAIAHSPLLPFHGQRWKAELQSLMNGFHEQGFVHGDLRSPNIVWEGEFVLLDFDWGGRDGEVYYPTWRLTDELLVDRKIRITKEGTIMAVLSRLGIVGNVFKKSDSPCSLTIVIRTLMDPKMRSLATIAA